MNTRVWKGGGVCHSEARTFNGSHAALARRRLGALLLGAAFSALGCGPAEPSTEPLATRQLAATGDLVRSVTMPSSIDCSDGLNAHVAISVAVIPRSAVGLTGDRALLATSCRSNVTGATVHLIDPGPPDRNVTQVQGVEVTPPNGPLVIKRNGVPFAPARGWGTFAHRADVRPEPDMLACANPATTADPFEIYSVNLTTGEATKMFDPRDANGNLIPAFRPFCDGMAWDPSNDTIYMSPDLNDIVYHYTGTDVGGTPGRLINTLPVPAGCIVPQPDGDNSGNSGIEVIGSDLFLACDGERVMFQVSQADGAVRDDFVTQGVTRPEDLECDRFTFDPDLGAVAPDDLSVLWTKDAFNASFSAFEVPTGSCGICRNAKLGDRKDITQLDPDPATNLANQQELAGLIRDYLTGVIVADHDLNGGFWHNGPGFLPAHRGYIGGLELYMLNVRGISKYVPLPAWNPATPIPPPFRQTPALNSLDQPACLDAAAIPGVGTTAGACTDITNFDPQIPLLASLVYQGPQPQDGGLCAFTSMSQLSPVLEGSYHNPVHCAVGGVMCSYFSPAALIFLPWHAYVDDIGLKWECSCQNLCQTCSDVWSAFPLTAPLAANSERQAPPSETSPIGFWWWFDDFVMPPELSPALIRDRAGFSLEGRMHGGAMLVPGYVGQSLRLDGRNDFVEARERSTGQVGSSDFTLDAWVKSSSNGVEPIVGNHDSDGVGYSFFLDRGRLGLTLGVERERRHHGRHFQNRRDGVERTFIAGGSQIADGEWHHVAAVVRRSMPDLSGLFVDGVLVLRFDVTDLVGDASSGARLLIGRSSEQPSRQHSFHRHSRFFDGEIDELTLVRSALGDDLIASIHLAARAGKLGSLGGLATWAEQPVCMAQLRTAIEDTVAGGHANADTAAALFEQAVQAILGGRFGLARNRLRRLRDFARPLMEPNPFEVHPHFHHIARIAAACAEQRSFPLN